MAIAAPPQQLFLKLITAYTNHQQRFRQFFLACLTIVLVITSVQYLDKVARPGDSGQQTRSAFLRWRVMILDVFHGVNIYTGLNEYPNPPIMAVILRPFVELPPVAGAMCWFYAKVVMAVVACVWVFRLLRPRVRISGEGPASQYRQAQSFDGKADLARAAAILIALPAMLGDLTHNNVNIFILFLLAATLELYRNGRNRLSGLVLALAIACKVTPLLFLAYFCWKRAWAVVAGCLLGLVLWLAVVPGSVLGWQQNGQLLTDWYRLMIERPIINGEVTTEHANQALSGFVYRLFTHSPSWIEYQELAPDVKVPVPARYHNIIDIGRPAAWVVVKALSALFALMVLLLCRAPREERQGLRFAAECGLIVLGMLLFSERTWKHHAVTLILPAISLASFISLCGPGRLRWVMLSMLSLAWALLTFPGMFGSRVGDVAMVYGTHTLAFVLLIAGIGIVLGQRTNCIGRIGPEGWVDQSEERMRDEQSE